MGLTYDGITYRSLEEQVRCDAEQIQVLKQADVTINENLQTVNTEINGKLTKPTNPSAESAVTMLADGTVGTKALSEIGGKLYNHKLYFQTAGEYTLVWINLITSSDTAYTQPSQFISLINKIPANVIEPSFEGIVEANGSTAADGTFKITLRGSGVNNSEVQPVAAAISITIDASTFVNDTYTEV